MSQEELDREAEVRWAQVQMSKSDEGYAVRLRPNHAGHENILSQQRQRVRCEFRNLQLYTKIMILNSRAWIYCHILQVVENSTTEAGWWHVWLQQQICSINHAHVFLLLCTTYGTSGSSVPQKLHFISTIFCSVRFNLVPVSTPRYLVRKIIMIMLWLIHV